MPHESSQRVLLSMTLLALLWVGVYWAWGPSEAAPETPFGVGGDAPRITFDPMPGPADVSPVVPPAGDGVRIVPPEFREYTLIDGDTLESIARREYGDASLWSAIARANPLRDAQRLRAGDVIRLPLDPGNIQGVAIDASGERTSPPAPAEPAYVEYLVKSGDTLSEIAQSYYGSFRYASLILEANPGTISSADDLRVGQTLRLPAVPPSGPAGDP